MLYKSWKPLEGLGIEEWKSSEATEPSFTPTIKRTGLPQTAFRSSLQTTLCCIKRKRLLWWTIRKNGGDDCCRWAAAELNKWNHLWKPRKGIHKMLKAGVYVCACYTKCKGRPDYCLHNIRGKGGCNAQCRVLYGTREAAAVLLTEKGYRHTKG